jgi:hypothetical protein
MFLALLVGFVCPGAAAALDAGKTGKADHALMTPSR